MGRFALVKAILETGITPDFITDHVRALLGPLDKLARVFKMYWPMAHARNFKAGGEAMRAAGAYANASANA